MPKQHAIERARSSAKPPTLARLAKLINQEHHAACRAFEKTVHHAEAAGRFLAEAKEKVPHGGWEEWVRENTDVSPRTARGYMQIACRFHELNDADRQHAADLSQRRFLEDLMQPPEDTVDTAAEEGAPDELTYAQASPLTLNVSKEPAPCPKLSNFPPAREDEDGKHINAELAYQLSWGGVMRGVGVLIYEAERYDPADLVQGVKPEELALHHEQIKRVRTFLDQCSSLLAQKLKPTLVDMN